MERWIGWTRKNEKDGASRSKTCRHRPSRGQAIATGIGLGFIAYVALKALAGRFDEINAAVGVIALAFLLKLIFA